jgi:hypothetical protein
MRQDPRALSTGFEEGRMRVRAKRVMRHRRVINGLIAGVRPNECLSRLAPALHGIVAS